jgi:thiamine-monophosphate kinase
MAGTPVAALLSFALPPELTGDWARRFLDGLLRLARLHNVPLAGGDTAQAAPMILPQPRRIPPGNPAGRSTQSGVVSDTSRSLFAADIVLVGSVPRGKALLRSGAQVGDSIYVTGALGGAAAELAMLELAPGSYARKRRDRPGHPHLFPQPRIAAGRFLLGRATAAIDLSDGLSTDLAHLCAASGVAAQIDASLLPIHHLAARRPDLSLDRALHGGEDYELLFTAPARRRFPAEFDGTPIHRIGAVVASGRGRPRITLLRSDGSRIALRNRGWEHFRKSS